MSDFYGTAAWKRLRHQALRRDGFRCTQCGADVRGKGQSRVDHILPRKTHPHLALSLSNLRTLDVRCDAKRHAEKGGHNRIPGGIGAGDGDPSSSGARSTENTGGGPQVAHRIAASLQARYRTTKGGDES